MRNVIVSWQWPTTREVSGGPLALSEILGMEVKMSADGGTTFSPVSAAPVGPPDTSIEVADLIEGEYFFQGVVIDTNNKRSPISTGTIIVPDENAPSAAPLTVTLVP